MCRHSWFMWCLDLDFNLERKISSPSSAPKMGPVPASQLPALAVLHLAVLQNIQFLCITESIISFSHWLHSLAFNQLSPNTFLKKRSPFCLSACLVLGCPCQRICKSIALTILSTNYLQMPVMSPQLMVNVFLINNASGSGWAPSLMFSVRQPVLMMSSLALLNPTAQPGEQLKTRPSAALPLT